MRRGKCAVILMLCVLTAGVCVRSGANEEGTQNLQPEGAKLVRFDFHKSMNREVGVPAGLPGYFTYYYQGKEYQYDFDFNKNGTGPESKVFGTAYVWAPYSIIHYDAAGGVIPKDRRRKGLAEKSTACIGNVEIVNSRGDGGSLGNEGNPDEESDRYATDYTIYGNSMNLTEGKMPAAEREGYQFLGWYVERQEGVLVEEEAESLAGDQEFERLAEKLNTPIHERTKLIGNLADETSALPEITVYAKWKRF